MEKSNDDIICNCMQITRGEIIDAFHEHQCETVDQIGDNLEAGTVCGTCQEEISDILRDLRF